ncbi:MAG: hypothetical protein K0R90_1540, partial [Oscillospiraceae bacterium]|nr:hypothetical protein [Oscillospiraceae bacterium]
MCLHQLRKETAKLKGETVPVKKLNNKGWTLVEVTVTLVVALIVMAFAGGILLSSFNVFLSNSSLNEAKMVGDNIY